MTKKELCELLGFQKFLFKSTYDRIAQATTVIEFVKLNCEHDELEHYPDTLAIVNSYLLNIMEDLAVQENECAEQIGKLSEEIVKEQLDAK